MNSCCCYSGRIYRRYPNRNAHHGDLAKLKVRSNNACGRRCNAYGKRCRGNYPYLNIKLIIQDLRHSILQQANNDIMFPDIFL